MQPENNFFRLLNLSQSQPSQEVSTQTNNPIDYSLLNQIQMKYKEKDQSQSGFPDQTKISQEQRGEIEIENSKIQEPIKGMKNAKSIEEDQNGLIEGFKKLRVEQCSLQKSKSSSLSSRQQSSIPQIFSREKESNISQDGYYQTVIMQLIFLSRLQQSISTISIHQNEKIMAHIEQYIQHLSLYYPKEMEYLKITLHNDNIQMLKKFRRVFPIKKSKSSQNKEMPPELRQHIKRYAHYNLPQCEKDQFSNYLIINLSFKQINLPQMLQCQWKNIIQLKLRCCGIDENGWQLLVKKIPQFDQLRLVDLSLNQIKEIHLQEFHPFMKLQYLKQLDLSIYSLYAIGKNPLIKQIAKVLIQARKLIGKRFLFEVGGSEFHLEQFKWQNFMKLDKQDLKMMEKISWINKKFDTQQWKSFVYQFKKLQSLQSIDFSENLIQNIASNELASLNLTIEKDQVIDRKLYIILKCNPLSKESFDAFEQFYKMFKWSKLCIIHQKITKEFHQKRLTNLKVKNQVSLIFLMVLKKRPRTDDELQNLIFTIENIVTNDKESEFANRKYLEEIVDYVLEEMKRVHGDQKIKRPQFLQNVEKLQKKMFKDYEKVISLAKENKMIALQ